MWSGSVWAQTVVLNLSLVTDAVTGINTLTLQNPAAAPYDGQAFESSGVTIGDNVRLTFSSEFSLTPQGQTADWKLQSISGQATYYFGGFNDSVAGEFYSLANDGPAQFSFTLKPSDSVSAVETAAADETAPVQVVATMQAFVPAGGIYATSITTENFTVTVVPEPAQYAWVLGGLALGFGLIRSRRGRQGDSGS